MLIRNTCRPANLFLLRWEGFVIISNVNIKGKTFSKCRRFSSSVSGYDLSWFGVLFQTFGLGTYCLRDEAGILIDVDSKLELTTTLVYVDAVTDADTWWAEECGVIRK